MRRPRLTIRRIMALVAVLAAGLGLGVPAARVAADRDDHHHQWQVWMDQAELDRRFNGQYPFRLLGEGYRGNVIHCGVRPPFWPRYRRCLAGRPWRRVPLCGAGAGHPGETCSSGHLASSSIQPVSRRPSPIAAPASAPIEKDP